MFQLFCDLSKFREDIMWPQIFHARPLPLYLEQSGSLVSTCQSCETSSGKHCIDKVV